MSHSLRARELVCLCGYTVGVCAVSLCNCVHTRVVNVHAVYVYLCALCNVYYLYVCCVVNVCV